MKIQSIALAAMILSAHAQAHTVCAGETYGGTVVTISVDTAGTLGAVQSGQVSIAPAGEPVRTYELKKEEITQFFESNSDDGQKTLVGLTAYVGSENPVSIRYSGTNFQDELLGVLRNTGRVHESGNEMRVWKGPGYTADQQHQFRDVVCSVTLDP